MDILPADLPDIYGFGYLSTPTVAFSDRDLTDLLIAVRRWNGPRSISGKLLVLEDDDRIVRFAQWIEGPAEELELCVERIHADTRHGDIQVQWKGLTQGRRFGGWDMSFETADADVWSELAPGLTTA